MNMMMSEEELAALPALERAQAKLYMLRLATQAAMPPTEAPEVKPPPPPPPPAPVHPVAAPQPQLGVVSFNEVIAAFSAMTSGAIERAVKSAIEAGVSSALAYSGAIAQQKVQAQLSHQADTVARGEIPASAPISPLDSPAPDAPIIAPAPLDSAILTGSAAIRSRRKTVFPPSLGSLGAPQNPAAIARSMIASMRPEVRSIIRCLCVAGSYSTRKQIDEIAGDPIDWRRYLVLINSKFKSFEPSGRGLLTIIGSPLGTEHDVFEIDQAMLVEFARELTEISGEPITVGSPKVPPVLSLDDQDLAEPDAPAPKLSMEDSEPPLDPGAQTPGSSVPVPELGPPASATPAAELILADAAPATAKTVRPVVPRVLEHEPAGHGETPVAAVVTPAAPSADTPPPVRKKPGPKPGFKRLKAEAAAASATDPASPPHSTPVVASTPPPDPRPAVAAPPVGTTSIPPPPSPRSATSTVSQLIPKAGAPKPPEAPRRPATQLFPAKDMALMVDLPDVEDHSILPQPGARWEGLG